MSTYPHSFLGHFSPIFPRFFPIFSPFSPSCRQDSGNRHQDPEKRSVTVEKRRVKTPKLTLIFPGVGTRPLRPLRQRASRMGSSPGDPDSFARFRPYLPHFFPVFFPFFARFHRLAETVPTNHKPESRAKRQRQGRPNTVSPALANSGGWERIPAYAALQRRLAAGHGRPALGAAQGGRRGAQGQGCALGLARAEQATDPGECNAHFTGWNSSSGS